MWRNIQTSRLMMTRTVRTGKRYRSTVASSARPHFGFVIVPQQSAFVVERLGRFNRVLSPGLHFLIPIVDRIAYTHGLKEEAVKIPNQAAITRDNVMVQIDGVLYVRVVDAAKASYGVSDPFFAITQLAQTTMRSEIGKIALDDTFREREQLNYKIVKSIDTASKAWGVECLRYEIKDIMPPDSVRSVMDMQAEAERRKRSQILDSEGQMQAQINVAEGMKRSAILEADGEAAAILAKAIATAEGLRVVAATVHATGGAEAASLRIAEQYVSAFAAMAKQTNTIIVPANVGDARSMVAQAMAIYQGLAPGTKIASETSPTLESSLKIPESHEVDNIMRQLSQNNNKT